MIRAGCARDKIGTLEVGDKVPVRFDPGDHSKLVLDLPALEARHQEKMAAVNAARQRADDEKVAKAQADIAGRVWVPRDKFQQQSDLATHRTDTRPGLAWTPVASLLLPVEASAKVGSGSLTCDGAMAAMLEQPAALALSYVAGRAAELVPDLDRDWFGRHEGPRRPEGVGEAAGRARRQPAGRPVRRPRAARRPGARVRRHCRRGAGRGPGPPPPQGLRPARLRPAGIA
jgi:hypothetical protein